MSLLWYLSSLSSPFDLLGSRDARHAPPEFLHSLAAHASLARGSTFRHCLPFPVALVLLAPACAASPRTTSFGHTRSVLILIGKSFPLICFESSRASALSPLRELLSLPQHHPCSTAVEEVPDASTSSGSDSFHGRESSLLPPQVGMSVVAGPEPSAVYACYA